MLFANERLNYMSTNKPIQVEVVYALPHMQYVMVATVIAGSTIEEVIQCSGILNLCPEISLKQQKIGIFGKRHQLSDQVKEGDRIEIYRSLTTDPKEKRRIKAKKIYDLFA